MTIRYVGDLTGVEMAALHYHQSRLARLERELVEEVSDDSPNVLRIRHAWEVAAAEMRQWALAIHLDMDAL